MVDLIQSQLLVVELWQIIISYLVIHFCYRRLSRRIAELSDAYRAALYHFPSPEPTIDVKQFATGRELYDLQMTWLKNTLGLAALNLVFLVTRCFDEPSVGLSNALLSLTLFFGWAGYATLEILARLRAEYRASRPLTERVVRSETVFPLD